MEVDGTGDLILVGRSLVAAGKEAISVISLPQESTPPEVICEIPTSNPIQRLVAADQKIFGVTAGGDILAYGESLSDGKGKQSKSYRHE